MRFTQPGPMSSLVSPIKLQLLLQAGDSNLVQIDLLGENGRLLQRYLERVQQSGGVAFRSFEIPFEIRAVSEKGYIRIATRDTYKRIQSLNTMPVLLYSTGSNIYNPIGNMSYERVMLNNLKDGLTVSGGVLYLEGRIWPFNEEPVIIDLLDINGKPITSRILDLNGTDTQDFSTTLPYTITEPTPVRLSIHQDNPEYSTTDPDYQKYIYVYSLELFLTP